jgi:hypothetical protein
MPTVSNVVVARTSSFGKNGEDYNADKGHTMIGQMLSVYLIKGEKYTGEEGQATIWLNVVVAVPVLTRKAMTVQERRAVLPEIIVSLLKSSFL